MSFETCYEVASEQLFSSSIKKYNISMLLRFIEFVDQFSECGLIFVTCKRNYVFFLQKTFFLFEKTIVIKELINIRDCFDQVY